jgi:hypothetical protein
MAFARESCPRRPSLSCPFVFVAKVCASRSKLQEAESEQTKHKQACRDQRVSQAPEWIGALETKLAHGSGTVSAAVRSAQKRSAIDESVGADDATLQQLQRPFKSPKV